MSNEVDDLLALYIEHENILTTLYLTGIIEEDEWNVIKIFLDNSEALENIRAVQAYQDLENEALEMSETPSQSTKQGAKNEKKPSEPNDQSASTSETPDEPSTDYEYIAQRVTGWQWLIDPRSSDKK